MPLIEVKPPRVTLLCRGREQYVEPGIALCLAMPFICGQLSD